MLQVQQVLQERYQLQGQLGRTAAGRQTWLVTDLQSNEQVTLKLLAFSPQMQWEELKLFEREAQVLQALNHPRIPRYRDYFSLDQQIEGGILWFGLVQDYIPGFSLQELLEKGKHFSEKQLQRLAVEVLQILIYLHELSPPVLHRDIKPSNLIWGYDKKIYLVDFGAVQAQAAVTGVTFTVVGTSGYAPLEQFWGRAVPASDLYALGATLIHLLTGTSPADLPQKDSRIQFSDRVSLNPTFVGWIEKMTEIALEKRYSTARKALQDLQSGQSQPATAPSPTLRKIAKPHGTSIKVNQSVEQLLISIPPPGIKRATIMGFLGIVFCGYFGVNLINFLFLALLNRFWLIINFSFLGLTHWLILGGIGIILLGEDFGKYTHIELNRTYLQIMWKTWVFTDGEIKIDIQEVLGVFLIKRGNIYQVCIRLENKNYPLKRALTENEGAWLAQEIQDWLN